MSTCWETGTFCPDCDEEIGLGQDMLYGRHPACARSRASARTSDQDSAVASATAVLAAGGRLALPTSVLRALVAMCCANGVQPVRRPDAALGGPWYGRMAGWKTERVKAGLSLPEVCGLYLDYLDVGRVPPLSKADLSAVLAGTEGANAEGGRDGRPQ